MRAFFQKCRKRLRSRAGQTFVLVMTVTAMGTVLGFMAMSAALMSMRVRAANRLADKTFYRLEMAEEEIRAGLSRDMMEVAAGASQGRDWRVMLLDSRMGIHDVNVLLPENAVRILVSADIDTIKERFKARMHGNLPAPVAQMLEKKHGIFDAGSYDYRFDGVHGDAAALCEELKASVR